MSTYTVSIQGQEHEVKPHNEKYLSSFFALVIDQRDPLSDSHAINTLKKIAVPTLPDEIATVSETDKDFYQWNPFVPFEEIFYFVMGVIRCQRLHNIDFLEEKKALAPDEKKRLSLLKDSLAAIERAISRGAIADDEDILLEADVVDEDRPAPRRISTK